jgi:hypothetical protein
LCLEFSVRYSFPASVFIRLLFGPVFSTIRPLPGAVHPSNPAIRPKFVLFETICIKLGQAEGAQAIGK